MNPFNIANLLKSETPDASPAALNPVQAMTMKEVKDEAVDACKVIGIEAVRDMLQSIAKVSKVDDLPLSAVETFIKVLRHRMAEEDALLPDWLNQIVPPIGVPDSPSAVSQCLFNERQRVRKAIRDAIAAGKDK